MIIRTLSVVAALHGLALSACGESGAGTDQNQNHNQNQLLHDGGPVDAEASAPDAAVLPLLPGGWSTATVVFSLGRLNADGSDDDWVQLGWIELDASSETLACGGSGPSVRKTFYRWTHSAYPEGSCTEDVVTNGNGEPVPLRRWDHTDVLVDGCPDASAWVDNGLPAGSEFLFDCVAHVTAGFGRADEHRIHEGHYQYDAATATLVFRYDVGGNCVKEYYHLVRASADGALLSMDLDGARTGDTTANSRGTGATHGYAFVSAAPVAQAVPLGDAVAHLGSHVVLFDGWRFREAREAELPQPEHYQDDNVLGHQHQRCTDDVYFDHSCPDSDVHPPYLQECAAQTSPSTAYLRFMIDPFPAVDSREHLFWAWHAHHSDWSGCYHRGSHSSPLLQVIDAAGVFRGYVGVEMQRTQDVDSEQPFLQTDYKVFRWVEEGFE